MFMYTGCYYSCRCYCCSIYGYSAIVTATVAAARHRTPATRGVLHTDSSICSHFVLYYERNYLSTPLSSTVAFARLRLTFNRNIVSITGMRGAASGRPSAAVKPPWYGSNARITLVLFKVVYQHMRWPINREAFESKILCEIGGR